MDKLKKILFVCTGNTCRSSMAEAIARQKLKEKNVKAIEVMSAGTGAFDGSPASPKAVEVLKEKNFDLGSHRSKRINAQMLEEADYIFTMTVIQKQQVLYLYSEAKEKTSTLNEFAFGSQGDLNIDDPFGGDADCYRQCAVQLEKAIESMLGKVIKKD